MVVVLSQTEPQELSRRPQAGAKRRDKLQFQPKTASSLQSRQARIDALQKSVKCKAPPHVR